MASQMGFSEQTQTGDAPGAGKLVPLRFRYRMQRQSTDEILKDGLQLREIFKARDIATERLNHPFAALSARKVSHGRSVYQAADCGVPHSPQNFAARRILLPQLKQNFVSPAGAADATGAAGIAATGGGACGGGCCGWYAAFRAWPMACAIP